MAVSQELLKDLNTDTYKLQVTMHSVRKTRRSSCGHALAVIQQWWLRGGLTEWGLPGNWWPHWHGILKYVQNWRRC